MAVDISRYRVQAEQVRWTCEPSKFPFTCTDQIKPPAVFIGQERAVRAIEFGLGIDEPGYNIFVTGISGTGKSTVIRSHLEAAVDRRVANEGAPPMHDWCYVFNFEHPDQPWSVSLPKGMGAELVADAQALIAQLQKDLPAAFNDESYTQQVRGLNDGSAAHRRELITAVERSAAQRGFTVQAGPMGVAVIPIANGKPMEQETYLALTDDQRQQLETARAEVTRQVEETMDRIRESEAETMRQLAELQQRVIENTAGPAFDRAIEKYRAASAEKAVRFLEGLQQYSMEYAGVIASGRSDDGPQSQDGARAGARLPRDPHLPFRVNLFVDNSQRARPAIVMEDNPTYAHLFGQIDRRPTLGAYVTDHTMLRPGSLVQASGGYLVIDARLALSHVAVWPALKRVLKGGEVRPEDPDDLFPGFLMPQPLRPEPIPIEVKVVLTGEPEIYQLLAAYDPDFWEIMKVRADLSSFLNRNEDNMRSYSEFTCGICNERGLRHFSSEGVAALIEYGVRLVGDRDKMSARFGALADVIVESSYWADHDGSERTDRKHVEKALEQKEYRSKQTADVLQELLLNGTLIVELEGSMVGQVNGLAVYSTGDYIFGKPSRITTQAYMGRDGFINIEREARLSGQTHDKGVLILAGYLGNKFARKFPLSVNISLAFEQSYGLVEGDSASSTELYSILSELSGVPIRQGIAVTGSVNQKGQIQPIGGANEKVEGFYDLCKASGKLGAAGVLLPARNLRNLMLRPEIVEAVRNGQFHIYAVSTIDEGIEVLTGLEAGERGPNGEFPAESINGKAEARLRDFANGLRTFYGRQD